VCDPCVLRLPALGPRPLPVARTEITVQRSGQNQLNGEVLTGAVRATWRADLARHGATLQLQLPDTPLADLYAVFAPAIPELARAHIEGRAGFELRMSLPGSHWRITPRIEGFRVGGLGTELLLDARPSATCAALAMPTNASAALPFGAWLPRAVVAAEDQRFFEHTGFDIIEMQAAWQAGTPRGASTLSQQLAKLVFTGSEPSAVRKLREMLYAVELDRTLGKPRVLQLYLGLAPWGASRCGAQAAAVQWLHKPAAALTPVEAAWLATLLRNPDAALQRVATTGAADTARVAAVLDGMRPVPLARRLAWAQQLAVWAPPVPVLGPPN